jgi:hypothetical protein
MSNADQMNRRKEVRGWLKRARSLSVDLGLANLVAHNDETREGQNRRLLTAAAEEKLRAAVVLLEEALKVRG